MKTKAEIVKDWLPRYTGRPLKAFGPYVLLTNFSHYVELFAKMDAIQPRYALAGGEPACTTSRCGGYSELNH